MPYSEKSTEIMKQESHKLSSDISNYMLDDVKVTTESLFPNDPSIKYQNSGIYKNNNPQFMDVNSEIRNITRPLTKDIHGMWTGGTIVDDVDFQDLTFSSKYIKTM